MTAVCPRKIYCILGVESWDTSTIECPMCVLWWELLTNRHYFTPFIIVIRVILVSKRTILCAILFMEDVHHIKIPYHLLVSVQCVYFCSSFVWK